MKEKRGREAQGRGEGSNRELSFFLEGIVCLLSPWGSLYIGDDGAALAPLPRREGAAGPRGPRRQTLGPIWAGG